MLGGSNGVEILKKLLGGSGSSSALASEVNFTVVGNDEFGSPSAALILDSNRIAVEVGTLFIEKLLGIAALGLDENTQKLLGGLDLKALVEVNFGEKFVTAEKDYTGTKYALDIETNKYYIDENGTFKRESNISLKLNAEAAELLGINVAVENIKIGNTGVEEKVKAIDINDYAEFIEILFGTEKDENGNENGLMLIDCGANAECTPEYLLQFGYMGSFYAKRIMNIDNPRVGLLNIGVEETKGGELQHETYKLLKAANDAGRINFVGNVEASTMLLGGVDVVVADGFSGNIALKTAEGVAKWLFTEIKGVLKKSPKNMLAAAMIKKDIKGVAKRMDPNEVGGTALLGISKPVIKAHGSSGDEAFFAAIRQAMNFAASGMIDDIVKNVEYMRISEEA